MRYTTYTISPGGGGSKAGWFAVVVVVIAIIAIIAYMRYQSKAKRKQVAGSSAADYLN